jgi:hypothetical protein
VAAQAYLFTTRPSPGDPREHMHKAALNGLKMVGNKLSAKEEEAYHNKGAHKPRSPRHHNSPRHRSVVTDLGHHHQSSTEEQENFDPRIEGTVMKTIKKRWEYHALLTEFTQHQYPKDSSYLMTSKSMMGHRSHSHGSRIICKQYKYW